MDQGENPGTSPSVVSLAIPACAQSIGRIAGGHTGGGKQRNFRKTRNGKKPIRKKHAVENDYPAGLKMIANAKAKSIHC
jgi:hypothetical protein